MKRYIITFSGEVNFIEADSKHDAWLAIRDYIYNYALFTVKEIGVDVDEHGFRIAAKRLEE